MIKNAIFLFVVLAAVFVVYLPSYVQMQDLRHRNEVFEQKIIALEKDNAALAEERERLKNDPEYFEKIARERMGLIKDGEVIYKVLPPGTKKSAPEDTTAEKPVVKKPATKKPAVKSKATAATPTKSNTKKVVKKPVTSKTTAVKD